MSSAMARMTMADSRFDIVPLGGGPGALLEGVDLVGDLDDSLVEKLRDCIHHFQVVFVRDQSFDYEAHAALAARFGELAPGHPIFAAPPGRPALRIFDSSHGVRANHWHTDLTFLERPPALSFLRADVVAPQGGDTMWADTGLALQTLPPPLRAMAECLRIIHSNDSDMAEATMTDVHQAYVATRLECEHPAIVVHPETGREALLLGGFARRVRGMGPQMSRDVLRLLHDHITRPEHCVRWRWKEGDLAIWDNLMSMHYAVFDYAGMHRRFERVTTVGPAIIGSDGRSSRVLHGPAQIAASVSLDAVAPKTC